MAGRSDLIKQGLGLFFPWVKVQTQADFFLVNATRCVTGAPRFLEEVDLSVRANHGQSNQLARFKIRAVTAAVCWHDGGETPGRCQKVRNWFCVSEVESQAAPQIWMLSLYSNIAVCLQVVKVDPAWSASTSFDVFSPLPVLCRAILWQKLKSLQPALWPVCTKKKKSQGLMGTGCADRVHFGFLMIGTT